MADTCEECGAELRLYDGEAYHSCPNDECKRSRAAADHRRQLAESRGKLDLPGAIVALEALHRRLGCYYGCDLGERANADVSEARRAVLKAVRRLTLAQHSPLS